ncbi:MAG: hypothetical protein LBL45_07825 [Treponema sp.]|jgi:hypothetical protein|nr:hypothetical protein [Treponema sp.]
MPTFHSLFGTLDITSRPKRRRAISLIIIELSHIREQEEDYLEHIPFNLQDGDAAAAANDSLDFLSDAILNLMEAY